MVIPDESVDYPMKADAIPLRSLLEGKQQFVVPLFQRQYVWNQTEHWEPLWEDILRKFKEHLSGRTSAPVHFLGAMVLQQLPTQTGKVTQRQVIDGQQRLTTLQIVLAVFRDFAAQHSFTNLSGDAQEYLINSRREGSELLKLIPTQADREQFKQVLTLGSLELLNQNFLLVKKKGAKKFDKRPSMVEAYAFFYQQLTDFFAETTHLETCFSILLESFHVVVVDLDKTDDAQVIFETLNARGAPLSPADLIRNYVFLRVAQQSNNLDALYDQYWAAFDQPFWRDSVLQGRLKRPHSDVFMQYFLTAQRGADISVKHLYVEYKDWIERDKPFTTIEAELQLLAQQGVNYRNLVLAPTRSSFGRLAQFLRAYDVTTCYPLMLGFLSSGTNLDELTRVSRTIESYILRRAACGYSTKNYNNIFLAALVACKNLGFSHQTLLGFLKSLRSESAVFPSDDEFESAFLTASAYYWGQKLRYILIEINRSLFTGKTEEIEFPVLTIEHLMPQRWSANWLLPDGSKANSPMAEDDPRFDLYRQREKHIHTIGNLTLITGNLNGSISNASWDVKRPEILNNSSLPINQTLRQYDNWDEKTIEERGQWLFEQAKKIWSRA